MPEIGTSGSMSGDGKRSDAEWPKLPRPSSTLPSRRNGQHDLMSGFGRSSEADGCGRLARRDANDPQPTWARLQSRNAALSAIMIYRLDGSTGAGHLNFVIILRSLDSGHQP